MDFASGEAAEAEANITITDAKPAKKRSMVVSVTLWARKNGFGANLRLASAPARRTQRSGRRENLVLVTASYVLGACWLKYGLALLDRRTGGRAARTRSGEANHPGLIRAKLTCSGDALGNGRRGDRVGNGRRQTIPSEDEGITRLGSRAKDRVQQAGVCGSCGARINTA